MINKSHSKDVLIIVSNQAINALIGFMSAIVYSNLLDPAEYGLYSIALTIALLIVPSLLMPAYCILIRFLSAKQINTRQLTEVFKAIKLIICLALIIIAVCFFYYLFNPINQFKYSSILLIIIYSIVLAANSFFIQFSIARQKRLVTLLFDSLGNLFKLITGTLFILLFTSTADSLLLGAILIGILLLFVQYRFFVIEVKKSSFENQASILGYKQIICFGLPFAAYAVIYNFQSIFERTLIQETFSSFGLGVYILNYQIACMPILMLISSIEQFLMPIFFYNSSSDRRLELGILIRVSLALLVAVTAVSLLVYLVYDSFALYLINPSYRWSPVLIAFLMLATGIKGIGLILSIQHSADIRSSRIFLPMFISSIFGAIMAIYCSKSWGINGICLAGVLHPSLFAFLILISLIRKPLYRDKVY